MKKVILILLLVPAFVFAQKPVKPSLKTALQLFQEGKLAEAKDMIDAATTYEKTMNDGKTYYYRGLIYAAIDTTSNPTINALAPNALDIAIESFKKADEMKKGSSEYSIIDPNNLADVMSNTKSVQIEQIANKYLQKSIFAIQQDEPDYEKGITMITKSRKVFENAMPTYSNDTLAYYILAVAGQAYEKYDTALNAIDLYLKKGGKAKEAYLIQYQIWMSDKKGKNKAKALEAIQGGKKALPNEYQFNLIELELLIDLGRVSEARAGLQDAVAKDPTNKALHFYLGYVNMSEGKPDDAKKNFEESLRLDPKYFEAQFYLAKIVTEDAIKIKKQINSLGISAADKKKKMDLDGVYVSKLKAALPYWEKAEKLNPSDKEVLDILYNVYADLGMDAQIQRVEKRMKELGMER